MQNAESPQRQLRHVLGFAETLPPAELRPSFCSVLRLAAAVSLSMLPAPLTVLSVGLFRVPCDYVNENVGPWGVRSTHRLIRAPLAAAGMSRKVHCILAPEIWTGLPLPRKKSQLQSVLSWRPSGSLAVEMQMWWDSFVTKSLECRAEEVGYIPMHLA